VSFLFFTSYARDNRASAVDEQYLQTFVSDLQNEIRQLGPPHTDEIAFFDTESIEGGDSWPRALSEALRTSRSCVCLYSPSYFNSKWCGKEFRVFRDRRDAWMAKAGNEGKRAHVLFPVIWIPPREVPVSVKDVQYMHDDYPAPYREGGLRQLMRLTRYKDAYNEFVAVLAQKIVNAALAHSLEDLAELSALSEVSSAFESAQAIPGETVAVTGGISKACFVFIAAQRDEISAVRQSSDSYGQNDGWDWRPFLPDAKESVGAMAQQVAGQLGVRFQEIPCDQELPNRLREAKKHHVPAILLTDVWSLCLPRYAGVMTEYDDLNLSNCAVLMPWNEKDNETVAGRDKLRRRLIATCPQKSSAPPPSHVWDGIRSMEDLRSRTAAMLDELRMRLLHLMLSAAGDGDVRKVENAALATTAAVDGIPLNRQPQLQTTPGGQP
jgi:FxsC-like protein